MPEQVRTDLKHKDIYMLCVKCVRHLLLNSSVM